MFYLSFSIETLSGEVEFFGFKNADNLAILLLRAYKFNDTHINLILIL